MPHDPLTWFEPIDRLTEDELDTLLAQEDHDLDRQLELTVLSR